MNIQMRRFNWRPLSLMGLAMFQLTSCISTTTNPAPEADDDNAARQYYQLGARYFHNGNYKLARDRLQRAIDLDPDLAMAHSVLGLTYEQLDNSRLASLQHEKAVKAAPRNHIVRNAYAVFLCGQKRYDDAEEQFLRAAEIPDNDNAEITLTNAGVCISNKPDYAKAELLFRQALEKKPGYAEALIQMSFLMYRTDEFLRSRAFLQRYLATNRATPEVLYLAVQVEKALGDDGAKSRFSNQLLREFPNSVQARRVLQAD